MRWLPRSSVIPLQRRWIIDILHFGQKTPLVGGSGNINAATVRAARRLRQPPISWDAIWVKAVAIAAIDKPLLRTTYLRYPWPRFYVHPYAVALVSIERNWNGSRALFSDQIKNPAALSLEEIEGRLRAMRELPIVSIGGFRRQIRIARMPWIVRRLLGHVVLLGSGRLRSQYFGTYSTMKALRRIEAQSVISPISFFIHWTPPLRKDELLTRLSFDHRLCEAREVAFAAGAIEDAMNGPIASELMALANRTENTVTEYSARSTTGEC